MIQMKKQMIRKFIGAASLAAASLLSHAQQKPHYTQYVLNQYIINPAITGIENYTDIKISHRHQWAGIDDAPVTTYFTIHTPIGKEDDRTTATSHEMNGVNPRGKAYWQDYTAAPPHHGVGLQVVNDRTGPLNNFSAYATYAYHRGISPRTSISAGFGAGISRMSVNTSMLTFGTPLDPAVYGTGIINKVRPDLNAGVYIYSSDYFIGVSALQILPQKVDFSNNAVKAEDAKMVPHIFATAGYRFLIGDNFNLIPSVMVKYLNPVPVQFEVNAKLQYLDVAWFGASYRINDGLAGMVGLNLGNRFNIGYSYDYTTSNLNQYSHGTHELMVGLIIGNTYESCPRNVW
jgi:type IX secretion system PorP/SprF family membrane protein